MNNLATAKRYLDEIHHDFNGGRQERIFARERLEAFLLECMPSQRPTIEKIIDYLNNAESVDANHSKSLLFLAKELEEQAADVYADKV